MESEAALTIEELAEAAGVSVRTVRYYIAEGLLPGPGARGKGSSYGPEHLLRLRLIRRLAEQHVPLAEQRTRLAGLSVEDLRQLLGAEERAAARSAPDSELSGREYVAALLARARGRYRSAEGPPPAAASDPAAPPAAAFRSAPGPAPAPVPLSEPIGAEAWQRWQLAPGVELHVRADALKRFRRLIEDILRIARASSSGRL